MRILKIVVLDKDTLGLDIDLSPIYALGEVLEYPTTAPEEVAERVSDAEVVIINKIKLGEQNLSKAQNLKLICVAATGYDNIDRAYCNERGIALCNVPGYSTVSVAQIAVSMALSLVNRQDEYRDFVKSGKYSDSGLANKLTPIYHEISSLKWGILGGGGIGTKVAEVASAFGSEVMVFRRVRQGKFPLADIDTICRECDIISVHLPLSEETRGMLSRERIASMKKTAIVINTARGAVTDEKALADAIKEERIGGLGVDVYSTEPFPRSHPFFEIASYPNVILTPHMAWGSKEARARCVEEMAKNIFAFFSGGVRNRIV